MKILKALPPEGPGVPALRDRRLQAVGLVLTLISVLGRTCLPGIAPHLVSSAGYTAVTVIAYLIGIPGAALLGYGWWAEARSWWPRLEAGGDDA